MPDNSPTLEEIKAALGWYFYQSESSRRLLDRALNAFCQIYGIPISHILVKLHKEFHELESKK